MREFWVSSGHHLTRRAEGGGLLVTDELLLAYLARPELVPPDDACAAERALHAGLLRGAAPARPTAEVAALADADARENWTFMLAFRDRLLRRADDRGRLSAPRPARGAAACRRCSSTSSST